MSIAQNEKERRTALLAEKLSISKAVIDRGNNFTRGYVRGEIPTGDLDQMVAYDPRTGAIPAQQQQRPLGNPQERLRNSKLPDSIKESFTKTAPIISEGPKSGTDQLMAKFFDRSKEITNKIDSTAKNTPLQKAPQRPANGVGNMRVHEMAPVRDDVQITDPNINEYYSNVAKYYQQNQPIGGGHQPINENYRQPQYQPPSQLQYRQPPQPQYQPQYQQQPQVSPDQLYEMIKQAVREVLNEQKANSASMNESIEISVGGKTFSGTLNKLHS